MPGRNACRRVTLRGAQTIESAARALGVSRGRLERAITYGRLRARWIREQWRIEAIDLNAFSELESELDRGIAVTAAAERLGLPASYLFARVRAGLVPAQRPALGHYRRGVIARDAYRALEREQKRWAEGISLEAVKRDTGIPRKRLEQLIASHKLEVIERVGVTGRRRIRLLPDQVARIVALNGGTHETA